MNDLKIGIIIPDRGDRPNLLDNCLRMMDAQTKQPDAVALINEPPKSDACDITYRYRIGYDQLRDKNLDCILLIENDDWYDPRYIERIVETWVENGKPDLLGYNYTIYYHIHLKRWMRFEHHNRASAMNTLIKPDMNFSWCPDHERYTDIWLWHKCPEIHSRKIVEPLTHLCMGIKHGIGMAGGEFHSTYLNRYKNHDDNHDFLKTFMDPESLKFYTNSNNFIK
jgi:hypothetical protein